MSQSKPLDLALAKALPSDPAEAETSRAKAADVVDGFVRQKALPALDAVLQAAEDGHVAADGLARDTVGTAAMLNEEVTRFRDLMAARSTSDR